MAALPGVLDESDPRYEGWRVVAATSAGVFVISAVFFTFPVFLKPLAEAFAWAREAVSTAYAAMTLASAPPPWPLAR